MMYKNWKFAEYSRPGTQSAAEMVDDALMRDMRFKLNDSM